MSDWRRPGRTVGVERFAVQGEAAARARDRLATEEPLELRIRAGRETRTLGVTMRTPGNDFELAAGFLLAEGLVSEREEVGSISYCTDPPQLYNVVNVDLLGPMPELGGTERLSLATSACGVCGKANLESLSLRGLDHLPSRWTISSAVLEGLPETARAAQEVFDSTGGLHAASLFDLSGSLLAQREDVGRHNAVDKVLGWALLEGRIPAADSVLLVSGRAGFELVQKALVAGVPFLASVSAPSSLAVTTARRFGMTLVGFLRPPTFNVYAGEERIALAAPLPNLR